MSMTQQHKQQEDTERHKREMLSALIGEQVIHTLGAPGDLLKVQVRPLWENHYRVNVLIGGDAASARIANSYFVKADSDGNIGSSTPKITKQY
jgi:hypothetical protein